MNVSKEHAVKVTEVTKTFRQTLKEIDLPLLQKGGLVFLLFLVGAMAMGLTLRTLCRFFFRLFLFNFRL